MLLFCVSDVFSNLDSVEVIVMVILNHLILLQLILLYTVKYELKLNILI